MAEEIAPASDHGPDEETALLIGDSSGLPSTSEAAAHGGEETSIIPDAISTKRLVLILSTVYVGVFLGALDSTVIATLSAPIATSFNSLSLLAWVASAYLIANSACQPILGRLTDIFSRRTGLVVSNTLFAAGNLICGLATSEGTMIAGRAIAGMGGGGLMAITTFVASDLVPLRQRGIIQGVGNICYGSGAGLGGLFGGWINDTWGWRVAFLAQVPVVIVSGILVYFIVDVPPKQSCQPRLSRVDFLGVISLVTTLLLLLLGLNSGGNVVPWTHPLVLTSLPLSMVSMAVFILIELRWAKEPIIPVRLLVDRTVGAACLTNWFTTIANFMCFFYVPIFFQVKGFSTTRAGSVLIPQSFGASVGSLSAGIVMHRTGKYKALGLFQIFLLVLGIGLLVTLSLETPSWPPYIYMFLFGVGYGGMLTVTLLAAISAVDHEHQAVITSATYAFRSTGSTLGVTIASALYQNILKSELWRRFGDVEGAAEEIERIRDNFDELKHLQPGWTNGVLDSYVLALRGVYATALAIAVMGLICAAFMRQHKLHLTLDRK